MRVGGEGEGEGKGRVAPPVLRHEHADLMRRGVPVARRDRAPRVRVSVGVGVRGLGLGLGLGLGFGVLGLGLAQGLGTAATRCGAEPRSHLLRRQGSPRTAQQHLG